MNDIDIDIILALAEGRLSGQAKKDALDHLAANPDLGAELAEQMSAISELQSMSPAQMTPQERADLRSNLIEQLHIAPALAAPKTTKRGSWWQPVFGVASVAALVLAVVVVPGMLTGNDDSSTQVAAVADESSSGADSSGAPNTREAAVSEPLPSAGDTVSIPLVAQSDVAGFFAAVVAPTSRALAPSESDGIDSDDATAEVSPPELEDVAADDMEDERQDDLAASSVVVDLSELEACLDGLDDDTSENALTPHAATPTDTGHIVHLGVETDAGVDYEISIDPATCEIVPINP